MSVLDIIEKHKIVAIIRLDDLSQAHALTSALIEGGIRALEFTLTNADAVKTIEAMRKAFDDTVAIGAGSVITTEQVQQVADAGGEFIVSPIVKADVIARCNQLFLPTMPGAYTPTEIQSAWEMGASVVKIFPATRLGPAYIKDILAPLPHLKLMPTGGIDATNMQDYLDKGAFGVGIGSSLTDKTIIANNDWSALTALARTFTSQIS